VTSAVIKVIANWCKAKWSIALTARAVLGLHGRNFLMPNQEGSLWMLYGWEITIAQV